MGAGKVDKVVDKRIMLTLRNSISVVNAMFTVIILLMICYLDYSWEIPEY
jgi:hypothetical protein